MQACNVITGLHGIELNVGSEATSSMRAAGYVEDAEETEDNASLSPTHCASEDEEPEAAATDAETSNEPDKNTSYKDFTTFWETRPTRDMSKQLSSHEIEVHKTDLNAATLEVWKLKTLTFMRRRHPHFGALLQLVWTDENNEAVLEIVTDSEYGAAANVWGASALLSLIDTAKPKGTVFEHELLELERQVPGTTSSGIDIATRIPSHH